MLSAKSRFGLSPAVLGQKHSISKSNDRMFIRKQRKGDWFETPVIIWKHFGFEWFQDCTGYERPTRKSNVRFRNESLDNFPIK